MANAGRKTKYTPETVKTLTDAIRVGSSYKDACALAGISHELFSQWREKHIEFVEALTRAEADAKHQRLMRIFAAGVSTKNGKMQGDWRADAWFLEKRFPQEFGTKLIVEIAPEHLALLKSLGMSPSDAWNMLIQELANATANANPNSD